MASRTQDPCGAVLMASHLIEDVGSHVSHSPVGDHAQGLHCCDILGTPMADPQSSHSRRKPARLPFPIHGAMFSVFISTLPCLSFPPSLFLTFPHTLFSSMLEWPAGRIQHVVVLRTFNGAASRWLQSLRGMNRWPDHFAKTLFLVLILTTPGRPPHCRFPHRQPPLAPHTADHLPCPPR